MEGGDWEGLEIGVGRDVSCGCGCGCENGVAGLRRVAEVRFTVGTKLAVVKAISPVANANSLLRLFSTRCLQLQVI